MFKNGIYVMFMVKYYVFSKSGHTLLCSFWSALTHCRLNKLIDVIYWNSPISTLGMSGYKI